MSQPETGESWIKASVILNSQSILEFVGNFQPRKKNYKNETASRDENDCFQIETLYLMNVIRMHFHSILSFLFEKNWITCSLVLYLNFCFHFLSPTFSLVGEGRIRKTY